MFLTDEFPERFESSSTFWAGAYRGRPIDAELQPDKTWGIWVSGIRTTSITPWSKSLIQSLQRVKCDLDWRDFQKGWRGVAQVVHTNVRAVIESVLDDHPHTDTTGAVNVADRRIAQSEDSAVRGWWSRLTRPEQSRFVDAVMQCRTVSLFGPISVEVWEEIVPGEKIPGERPLTLAEQKARRAAQEPKPKPKPKPRKKAKPKLKLRRPPQDPEPISRQFGVCRRCRVCLAYDVNEGCCTVCGGGLTANPSAKEGIACGLCFPWAWRDVFDNGGTLVHGTVTAPQKRPRHTYAHAWVERDGKVYDWQTMKAGHGGRHRGKGYPRDLFYDLYEPEEVRRFDQEEAMVNLPRYGHYGPWDDAPTENPEGRWVDSPTFRYQLFIPRHEKDWKGLPRTLALEPPGQHGVSNKPFGAFWTSTLGKYDGEDTSDWESWMRGNMPSWHVPKGIVLEVGSHANVKHLRTKQEAEDFLNEYGTPGLLSRATGEQPRRERDLFGEGEWWGLMQVAPEWERLFEDFDGLHLEGGALAHPAFYGWDAESTAWFTSDPLREVRQIDLAPAEREYDEYDPEEENPPPRRQRKRLKNGRLTRAENARLFRRLMRQ